MTDRLLLHPVAGRSASSATARPYARPRCLTTRP